MEPESNLLKFITFGFFFPTVVSGPIRRYTNFATQTAELKPIQIENLMVGLFNVGLGFIYKFGADQFANYQDKMDYFQAYSGLKGGSAFLFVISMHIFLDFAGYSYIAIGIARILGIRIPQNFNAPYLATSVINFWDRWHISLSSWVRDYLYIPLGGSRVIFLRQAANLLICMAVIGLWHGFGLQFLIWGTLQGIGLVLNHFIRRVLPKSGRNEIGITSTAVRWFCTMIFVSVSWVFFFYSPEKAFAILKSILSGFKI
jgi:alginate O-acetyltransferase complex protein AlgI